MTTNLVVFILLIFLNVGCAKTGTWDFTKTGTWDFSLELSKKEMLSNSYLNNYCENNDKIKGDLIRKDQWDKISKNEKLISVVFGEKSFRVVCENNAFMQYDMTKIYNNKKITRYALIFLDDEVNYIIEVYQMDDKTIFISSADIFTCGFNYAFIKK